MNGARLMRGYLSNLAFSTLLAMTWAGAGSSNDGRVAGEWRHNGDIEVRGGAHCD